MPRNQTCKRCPLHDGVNTVCLWGVGRKPTDIMLLGEAPGANEDAEGEPFIGNAGQTLDECLESVGLDRSTVYISNAVKCRPPGNRDPEQGELAACFSYLVEEIAAVRPKVIVCLGRIPLKILTGKESIKDSRGKPVPPARHIRLGDTKIISTYHPAAYLHRRDKTMLAAIKEDLELAAQIAGRSARKLPEHEKVLIYPGDPVQKLIDGLMLLKDCKRVSVDCEWTAGDVDEDQMHWPWTPDSELFSIAIAGRVSQDKIVSVATAWPATDDPDLAFQALQAFMSRRLLTFHNAMADLIWLIAEGFRIKAKDDTQFLGYLINEEQRLNLDRLAPLYAGVPTGWKIGPWGVRPRSRHVWSDLLSYNADDVYATDLLRDAEFKLIMQRSEAEQRNLARAYSKLLIRALPPFVEMAINGVGIDVEDLKEKIDEIRAHRESKLTEVAEMLGMRRDIAKRMISSPQKLLKFLKDAYHLEVEDTQAETLEPYGDTIPVLKPISEIKHDDKLLGTYLEKWYTLAIRQGDGRLHFIYRLDKSRTGRTTAQSELGGSIQVAPRHKWLRNLFVARPGYKIVAADESQIELRMIAWLAPEKNMQRIFNEEGADLHRFTAAYAKAKLPVSVFVRRKDEFIPLVTDDERQAGKSHNFGLVFGMQDEKYVRYARSNYGVILTLEEAHESRIGFFTLYDDLEAWHARCEVQMRRGEQIVMPFGRHRRGATDLTQYINTPIQTTANDISLFAAGNAFEDLENKFDSGEWDREAVFFIGFIHDSIMLEVRDDYVEQVETFIKYHMEHPPVESIGIPSITVPLVADVKVQQRGY